MGKRCVSGFMAAAFLCLSMGAAAPPTVPLELQCVTVPDGKTLIRHITDANNDLTLTITPDGHSELVAKVKGEWVYKGSYTTTEERAKVPKEISITLRLGYAREKVDLTDANEWAVLGPRMKRVLELQEQWRDLSPAQAMDLRQDAAPPPAPDSPMATLHAASTNPRAAILEVDMKNNLAKFRDMRKKLRDGLTQAQEELKKVCSIRQEGILVYIGILD